MALIAMTVLSLNTFALAAEEQEPSEQGGEQEAVVEDTVVEDTVAEDTVAENAVAEDAVAENTVADERGELRAYIEDMLIPMAVAVVTAFTAFWITVRPIVKGAIKAVSMIVADLKSAKGTVDEAAKSVKQADSEKSEAYAMIAEMRADIADMRSRLQTVERIERIGFGNIKELVVGGYAKEIGRIGADDEGKN